jgi:hypothetical protein
MRPLRSFAALAALGLFACAPLARAQSAETGGVAFEAHATPTDGRPEPVRQLTFYLLRRSYAEIQREAEAAETRPEMDRFIEGLEVSKELKAWMKKQHTVELSGADFLRRLKPDAVLGVPEFYEAYLRRNSGDVSVGFPSPKFREADKQKNPEKYEKQKQDYHDALLKFMQVNPQSTEGMEIYLDTINPAQRWAQQQLELHRRLRRRTVELAQLRYLAAKTDSDLEGRGAFTGLAPGDYWLSNLDTEAVAGDVRLRWDAPVTIRAGQTARVELSNLNAVEPRRPAP